MNGKAWNSVKENLNQALKGDQQARENMIDIVAGAVVPLKVKIGKVATTKPKVGKVAGFKVEQTRKTSAAEANNWWTEQGYTEPPYKPDTTVTEFIAKEDTKFVRYIMVLTQEWLEVG